MTILKDLPYKWLKLGIRAIQIRYYTVPWPETVPSLIVQDTASQFEATMRAWGGFEGMYLSYRYKGQVLNLRRPEGTDEETQLELHIRARDHEDGIEVIGHIEASRYEHKTKHINEDGLRWLEPGELEDAILTERL